MIEWFLFAGCLSGRRLKAAFGEELLATIRWEESTRQIAGDARTVFPPDPEHIRTVLKAYQPKIVLTFGKTAGDAVAAETLPLWSHLIQCYHPAARHVDTVGKLKEAAEEYREALLLAEDPRWELTYAMCNVTEQPSA